MFLLEIFNLIAVFVFAISASLSAIKRKFDLFGIAFVAFVTSIGGGTIRDVLLGNYPVSWMREPNYAYSIIAGVLVSFIFTRYLYKLKKTFFWFDTIGIGVASVIGTHKAIIFGLSEPLCILFGVISAIFGGVIRDTLCNDIPLIFRKEIYATACLIGSTLYLGLYKIRLDFNWIMPITIMTTITIRYVSIKYKIRLPELTYKLKGKPNV